MIVSDITSLLIKSLEINWSGTFKLMLKQTCDYMHTHLHMIVYYIIKRLPLFHSEMTLLTFCSQLEMCWISRYSYPRVHCLPLSSWIVLCSLLLTISSSLILCWQSEMVMRWEATSLSRRSITLDFPALSSWAWSLATWERIIIHVL